MDSSRQRIIRPDSALWTPPRAAVRRSRSRRPLGAPLCSTTFGGSTIPPLFGGGGGGNPLEPFGWEFIGANTTKIPNNTPAGIQINMPSFSIGDLLVVSNFISVGSLPGWTTRNTTNVFVRTRIADGGAFDMPSTAAAAPADQEQLIISAAYRNLAGLIPTFNNGRFSGGSGPTAFVLSNLLALNAFPNCLIIASTTRNSLNATEPPVPVFKNFEPFAPPSVFNYFPAANLYSLVPPPSNRNGYISIAHAGNVNSNIPVDQWKGVYDPFDNGTTAGSTGYTMQFRGA